VKVTPALWTSGPLVPVTVTGYLPGIVELQDMVAVPAPVRVDGLMTVQLKPEGSGESSSVTVPAKPSSEVTVIVRVSVEVPSEGAARTIPEFVVDTGNDAASVKSWIVYVTPAE